MVQFVRPVDEFLEPLKGRYCPSAHFGGQLGHMVVRSLHQRHFWVVGSLYWLTGSSQALKFSVGWVVLVVLVLLLPSVEPPPVIGFVIGLVGGFVVLSLLVEFTLPVLPPAPPVPVPPVVF